MKDETRRKIDKAVKISLIVAGLLLICNDVYWRWHSRSGTQANNAVNRTVESIQNQTNLLEAKLNLADEKLKQQKNTSTELLTQLSEAKKQLALTQEALTNSKRSLVNAKESLKRSENLYEKLKLQMESERQKAKRVKHQRNLYAGCVIFAVVYAAAK